MATVHQIIQEATINKQWSIVYGLYWFIGFVSRREAERLHFQKYLVIKPEGNYYERE